jgi:putative ABC transport system substrate-binding protein
MHILNPLVRGYSVISDELDNARMEHKHSKSEYSQALPNYNEISRDSVAACAAGVTLSPLPVRRAEEISEALDSAVNQEAHALVVLSSPLIFQQHSQIVDFARQKRLPTVSLFTCFPRVGGLVAYGPNVASMHMRAANYIHRVLSSTKPGDLPIERPSRFELVVNLKTAEALGLTIPHSILDLADEVIE